MNRGFFLKGALYSLVGLLFIVCVIISARFYLYPFGSHPCGLVCPAIDLVNYANDHHRWFPNNGGSPLGSLKLLYPYPTGAHLAGISGSRDEVKKRIPLGLDLDERVSSLVYFPGLRDSDDPEIMILYERQEGVGSDGGRLSGHAVAFVTGQVRQIPQKDWARFLKDQEALRKAAIGDRVAPTNTDLLAGNQ